MKNDMIVTAFNTIQPDEETRNRVWEKAGRKQSKRRSGLKLGLSFAALAAALCLTFFGGPLFGVKEGGDLFTIKAYAMAATEDGAVQISEVAMVDDQPEEWGGYIDFATNAMYVGLGFKCEGENLESVELVTDKGFFARQYIGDIADSMEGLSFAYVGSQREGYQLFMVGDDVDMVGDTISFDQESLKDYLFFWGQSYGEDEADFEEDLVNFDPPFPDELRFQATATLTNGKTAAREIIIDLSAPGEISFTMSEEQEAAQMAAQRQKQAAHHKLLESLPLEQCETIVQPLRFGDTYEYRAGDESSTASLPITEEAMSRLLFNASGSFTLSSYLPGDGKDGHLVTLTRHDDGTFIGATYLIPGELIMEYYQEEACPAIVYLHAEAIPAGDPRLPVLPDLP